MATVTFVSPVTFRTLRHKSRAALELRVREVSSLLHPPAILPDMAGMRRDEIARHLVSLYRRLPD